MRWFCVCVSEISTASCCNSMIIPLLPALSLSPPLVNIAGFVTSRDIFIYADQLLFNLQIYKPKSCSQPGHVRAPYKTTCRRTPGWSCWITRRLPWQTIEWFLGRWAMTQTSQTYNNFIGCHCETTKLVYPISILPIHSGILPGPLSSNFKPNASSSRSGIYWF